MEAKKILLRYFLFFFILIFLIFNWSKISWVFYPDYFLRFFSFYFFEKPKLKQSFNTKEEFVKREDSIEIPKIGVSAPLIFVNLKDKVSKALNEGAVFWPDSAFPGERGKTIILGHSAPRDWPKIKYDWIFSEIEKLEKGDKILIYFKNKKFEYEVVEKIFLEKGEKIPEIKENSNFLILISCWPPGKDLKRIAIISKIKLDNKS